MFYDVNMLRFFSLLTIICFGLTAVPSSFAQQSKTSKESNASIGKKATFPQFSSSTHLFGPKAKTSQLRGKVVFFEYWGINCPPCIASFPHLVKLYNQYKDKGFMIVGSHCQGASDKIEPFLKKSKVSFPIYQMVSISEAPCPGGLPFAVLVGANGKIVASGRPSELYDLVKKEMRNVGAKGQVILDESKLNKYKSLGKAIVSDGVNIEAKITPLRTKQNDLEAEEICAEFDAWLDDEKVTIQEILDETPLEAIPMIQRLTKAVPSVKDFNEQLAELKANKELPKLAEIKKKIDALQGRGTPRPADVQSLLKVLAKYEQSTNPITQKISEQLKETLTSLVPPQDEK